MLRKSVAAMVAAVSIVGLVQAADREVPGKIVKYDAKTRDVTLQTSAGETEAFKLAADCKVLDAKGAESKDGLTDRRLSAGADVTLFIPDKARTVKEVRLGAAKTASKSDAKTPAKIDAKAPAKSDPNVAAKTDSKSDAKAPAKGDSKAAPKVVGKAAANDGPKAVVRPDLEKVRAAREKGTKATVVRVDLDKGAAQIDIGGKKSEIKITEDVVFYGPLGGISDKKIKDDRFIAESEIVIVYDASGKTVKEIHLPYRKSDDDKSGKAADKKKAG